MLSGVRGQKMYLGMIVGLVIVVFLSRGKNGVCRLDSAGNQLCVTQRTSAYRN
jgi:hypothetical protein